MAATGDLTLMGAGCKIPLGEDRLAGLGGSSNCE